MRIKAFQALRPPADRAARVASPPYDVVDTAEARRQAEGNPDCFFHVSRPEIDLPDGTGLYDEIVYRTAAANFAAFRDRGTLLPDPEPGLYLYRLTWGAHAQTGLIAVCHADDYAHNVIRKHEKTRQAPEDDRTRHLVAVEAHTGPVLLAYRDQPEVDRLVSGECRVPPLYDVTAADGIRHEIWKARDPAALERLFAAVPAAYIADGHHRAAAAARIARERRAAGGPAAEESDWFLAVLFPASRLKILPYNRCVRDLNGLAPADFLRLVGETFEVTPAAHPAPEHPGRVHLFLGNQWHRLSWPSAAMEDPVASLDASVLQDRLLGPVLGIDDPRKNPRIEFVGGIHGTKELEARVRSGRAAAAFSLYPTTVEQLMAVADRGLTMPPKSTWFEPKLRDGLVIHPLKSF
ncbi:MAG TPA: DUF1015 family protein [Kiritimatiellia bacterium]|nr:DUF1015 family protein [Kiritimatiellia bacterium]HRZ10821.1 DUF1015 family protein [Kiritimatiellia bacterium]